MDPQLLRGALRIAVLVAGLALLTLPFQPSGSAEFVVTVLAAIVGLVFAGAIAFLARAAHPPLPRRAGKGQKGYNTRDSRRGP